MKDTIVTLLFLAGCGLLIFGVHLYSPPFAWIVGGLNVMLIAFALNKRPNEPRS